jgi:hypothetical protein
VSNAKVTDSAWVSASPLPRRSSTLQDR